MNIVDYEYDRRNFRKQAEKALDERETASQKLFEIEARQKRTGRVTMEYYRAYHKYMSTDNAHMKSFLDFIKYYYDTMVFYGMEKDSALYLDHAQQAKAYFDDYYKMYETLKEAEASYKKALTTAEMKDETLTDMGTLYALHCNLAKSDMVHLSVHAQVEQFRDQEILPFFEKCDILIPETAEEECLEPIS